MTSSGTVDIRARGDITSVEHFVSEVFRLRTEVSNRKLWYRGHSDIAYKLIPMVGRPLKYADKTKTLDSNGEIAMLHRFRRRAYPYAGRAMTAGEAIFLARHHGLPTRLLDWTANALFSLYFTCNEKLDKEGQVWAMHYAPDRMDVDAFELANRRTETELFDPPFVRSGSAPGPEHQSNKYAIKIIHPFYNSPRLLAQDGAFTMHSDPWNPIEQYAGKEFTRETRDIETLYSWRVLKQNKVSIIKDLSGLGITHRLVYPDLDGVAKSLWETEVLWQGNDV